MCKGRVVQKNGFVFFHQVIYQSRTFARAFFLGQSPYSQNLSRYFTELYGKEHFRKKLHHIKIINGKQGSKIVWDKELETVSR